MQINQKELPRPSIPVQQPLHVMGVSILAGKLSQNSGVCWLTNYFWI